MNNPSLLRIRALANRLESLWLRFGWVVLLAVLIAALIPIFWLGMYDYPSADDYNYGCAVPIAKAAGRALLPALWGSVRGWYLTWQGTYSAMALMIASPAAFSQGMYWITPFVNVGALILGSIKLLDTLLRRIAGRSFTTVIAVAVPLLLLSTQLLPSPLESFYWWNGSVYYTFTFGLSLLYYERLLLLSRARTRKQLLWGLIPALVLAVFLGGNNYVSALLSVLLGGLFFLYALLSRKKWWPLLLCEVVLLAGFAVSILAPGNAVRQDMNQGFPPLQAIWVSITYAWEDIYARFFTLPVALTLVLLAPLFWRTAKHSGLRFRWPGLFLVISYLLFAAQNAPHFYAAGWWGPGRLRNIVFFSFLWLVGLWEFYLLGWIQRVTTALPKGANLRLGGQAAWLAAALLLAVNCWTQRAALTSYECIWEVRSGQAAAYATECRQRLELLQSDETDVVLPAIQTRPAYLFYCDLTDDPDNWLNYGVKQFFGKNSVVVSDLPQQPEE